MKVKFSSTSIFFLVSGNVQREGPKPYLVGYISLLLFPNFQKKNPWSVIDDRGRSLSSPDSNRVCHRVRYQRAIRISATASAPDLPTRSRLLLVLSWGCPLFLNLPPLNSALPAGAQPCLLKPLHMPLFVIHPVLHYLMRSIQRDSFKVAFVHRSGRLVAAARSSHGVQLVGAVERRRRTRHRSCRAARSLEAGLEGGCGDRRTVWVPGYSWRL